MSFENISFSDQPPIIIVNNELQTTLLQHAKINTKTGKVTSTSTLIALSEDNGRNWTFIDTNNEGLATLKKIVPNLSSKIVIPATSTPRP